MTRYDFAELERLLLVQIGPRLTDNGQHAGKTRLVAEALGTSPRQVYRWRKIGVTAEQADRLAVAAGLHPVAIWPEYEDEGKRDCPQCAHRFMPWRRDQRFCSTRCNRWWWAAEAQRRRRQRDPEWAERERQRKRVYYAECAAVVRAKERARYRKRRESMVT